MQFGDGGETSRGTGLEIGGEAPIVDVGCQIGDDGIVDLQKTLLFRAIVFFRGNFPTNGGRIGRQVGQVRLCARLTVDEILSCE